MDIVVVPEPAAVVEVVEVLPQHPASPVSDDDVSLSERRILNVVSHTLWWDNVQPRNLPTRAETRATRHYIRHYGRR